ncbi:MAG: hypothetical protein WC358_08315 [Ignavibacteria bacterium]|jgi:hypothetical protein
MTISKGWIVAGIIVIVIIIGVFIYDNFIREKTVIVQGIPLELYEKTIKAKDDSLNMFKAQEIVYNKIHEADMDEIAFLKASKNQVKIIYKKEIEEFENANDSTQINLLNQKYKKRFK